MCSCLGRQKHRMYLEIRDEWYRLRTINPGGVYVVLILRISCRWTRSNLLKYYVSIAHRWNAPYPYMWQMLQITLTIFNFWWCTTIMTILSTWLEIALFHATDCNMIYCAIVSLYSPSSKKLADMSPRFLCSILRCRGWQNKSPFLLWWDVRARECILYFSWLL
jgi:hypothetical protein